MRDELHFLRGSAAGGLAGGGVFFTHSPAAAYRASELQTATPRRLAELLYDGAIRLCQQAVEALDDGDFELAGDRLTRARRILGQVQASLEPLGGPDTRRLWRFCEHVAARLAEADHYRRRETLTETIDLLACHRPDWAVLTRPDTGVDTACGAPATHNDWIG